MAMKKLSILFVTMLMLSACATTNETKSARKELHKEKVVAEQAVIKQAIESRRFIIKLNRIYLTHGGIIDLVPRANYIIINGERAIIRAAYLGRQFESKPIAGINMRGRAQSYELTNDISKGMYKIKMAVNRGEGSTFDVYLTISKNGYCNVSVNSLKIDYVSYTGYVVPISGNTSNEQATGREI